ncbi:hypothetical protein FS837_004704 [Tulasnella sp. UAMH 9824]|nr:hypothetical protein FS837_004704 [Tulasnella sp. UAMH 9824]
MSFVGCVTTTSKPAFTANQIRRTPSIGLLGQNAQQQPAGPMTPGVQQFPTQLPSNPDPQATLMVSGNSNLEFTPPSTTSSGQLRSPAGVQNATAVSRPLPDAAFDNQATLSRQSSVHLTRWPSSSPLQQSSSLSSPNRADEFARRLSLDTTSYPQSTQVAGSSQTPPLQSQSTASHSQIPSRPDNFWKHVLESKPKPLQREGSSQSDLSCATTEPASREPSPLLHEGRDPSLPVPVPRMPGLGHTLGRTEVEHAPSPPMSPRSQALSMGLKERDFAYEDFPGKAEHQKALAAMKAARKALIQRTATNLHVPVPLAALYPKRYRHEAFSQYSQASTPDPPQLPSSSAVTRHRLSTPSSSDSSHGPIDPHKLHTSSAAGPARVTHHPPLVLGTTISKDDGVSGDNSIGILVFDSDGEGVELDNSGCSLTRLPLQQLESFHGAASHQARDSATPSHPKRHQPLRQQSTCEENSGGPSDGSRFAPPDDPYLLDPPTEPTYRTSANENPDSAVGADPTRRSTPVIGCSSPQESGLLQGAGTSRTKESAQIIVTARHQVSKSVERLGRTKRTASLVLGVPPPASLVRPDEAPKRKREDSQILEELVNPGKASGTLAESSRSTPGAGALPSMTRSSRMRKKRKAVDEG